MREELEDMLDLYAGMPAEGQAHWVERSLPSLEFESEAERAEFLAALHERDKPRDASAAGTDAGRAGVAGGGAVAGPAQTFSPGQRVKANLAGLKAGTVQFSQNVEAAYAEIDRRISDDPPVYRLKLLISFRGVTEVDVPAERIRPM